MRFRFFSSSEYIIKVTFLRNFLNLSLKYGKSLWWWFQARLLGWCRQETAMECQAWEFSQDGWNPLGDYKSHCDQCWLLFLRTGPVLMPMATAIQWNNLHEALFLLPIPWRVEEGNWGGLTGEKKTFQTKLDYWKPLDQKASGSLVSI